MKLSNSATTSLVEATLNYCKTNCGVYDPNIDECNQCTYGKAIAEAVANVPLTQDVPKVKANPIHDKRYRRRR